MNKHKKHNISLIALLAMLLSFIGFVKAAQTSENVAAMGEARAQGEKIANAAQNDITSILNSGEAQNEIKKAAGYDEQKAADIKGRGLDLGDSPTLGAEAKEQDSIFSQAATNARDAKLDDEYGFRKDQDKFTVDSKGYMDAAKHRIKDAASKFDFISGKYKQCESGDETTKYKAEEMCDEYFDVKISECLANQVVEIDPKYTYQCTKKREEREKVCTDVVTAKCNNEGSNCNSGGIVMSSLNSDMQFTYNYPELIIGTIADNYWSGSCTVYDRSTTFDIINLDKITEFSIKQVGFDDYMWIKVNGHTVYVGPDGGDRIEVTTEKEVHSFGHIKWETENIGVTNGAGLRGCERMTNWVRNVDIDLKNLRYLHEGKNEIWIRVIVSGHGKAG